MYSFFMFVSTTALAPPPRVDPGDIDMTVGVLPRFAMSRETAFLLVLIQICGCAPSHAFLCLADG